MARQACGRPQPKWGRLSGATPGPGPPTLRHPTNGRRCATLVQPRRKKNSARRGGGPCGRTEAARGEAGRPPRGDARGPASGPHRGTQLPGRAARRGGASRCPSRRGRGQCIQHCGHPQDGPDRARQKAWPWPRGSSGPTSQTRRGRSQARRVPGRRCWSCVAGTGCPHGTWQRWTQSPVAQHGPCVA